MSNNHKNGLVYRACKYSKAISDPQRMKMMKILGSNAPDTICVSDVASILGLSQPSATKHLQVLYEADLISRKRIGTSIFYSINIEAVRDFRQLIDHAFKKAFTPCPNHYDCDSCEGSETCL
ncbi:MAG: metalloregulator ArsR/SmtB family transcription factor [Oscillospiraceae bacterium]